MIDQLLQKENRLEAELDNQREKIRKWIQERCEIEIGIQFYSGDGLGIYEIGLDGVDEVGMGIEEAIAIIKKYGRITNLMTSL